jgi:murein DD-endopeptidase MepM/ murein hydrolase activator NlpD
MTTLAAAPRSGASTGPHLHFEIRVNGTTPVDPLAWMHARLG